MIDDRNDALPATEPADPQRTQPSAASPPPFDLGETALTNGNTPRTMSRFPLVGGRPAEWIGRKVGKYRITGVLGQGGMGLVVRGHDPLIERDVAIKLLAPEVARDEIARNRFLAEAKAAGRLNHPHVVAIHEIGQENDLLYLVMELVPGGSVGDRLVRDGACTVLDATRFLIDSAKGLGAAHRAGIVHRDVKPANLLIADDGSVKATDFGLAKAGAESSGQLTRTGTLVGTPYYMSPEQCEGKPADARSDIYSLGATYYSLLTGRQPYQDSESMMGVMYAHCHAEPPDPRAVDATIPHACSEIIARAMAKSPADRYQSLDEMLKDLEAVRAVLSGAGRIDLPSSSGLRRADSASRDWGPPKSARRRFVQWATLGLGVVAVALSALMTWQPWRNSESGANPANAAGAIVPPGGEPIRIGVLHSMSGTMSGSESAVVDAVLFAVDEINAAGGLLGRPVKAVVADGRSDDATFAREAERLISREKVCAVFGCWTSASRKTVKPIFEEHDHLLVYPLQYEGIELSPNIIYMGAAPNQQIVPAVTWAVEELGKRRFFLVGSDYVFPRAAGEIIKDHLKSLGAEVAGEAYLPLGGQNVGLIVEEIARKQPDMILNAINGDTNTAFFRALRAAGVTSAAIPCLSFSIGEQELRTLNADDVAGDYAAWTYFQTLDTPANRDFVRRYHEKHPQRPVTDPMESAYAGVMLWAQAVRETDGIEPRRVRRAMLSQRFESPGGEIRLDADTQHAHKTPRVGRIGSDGEFEIVWSAAAPVRPDPFPDTRTAADWLALLHDLHTGWGGQWSAPAP
ncbi:MAG: transporter substrate-binding protein [Planctomycetaceae bacterium]